MPLWARRMRIEAASMRVPEKGSYDAVLVDLPVVAVADGREPGPDEEASQDLTGEPRIGEFALREIRRRLGWWPRAGRLAPAIRETHRRLRARDPGWAERGAAGVTVALIGSGSVAVAQVGDTRGYLLRGVHAIRVTNDHVAEFDGKARNWSPESADELVRRRVGAADPVGVDVVSFTPRLGDQLLVCTDGLWRILRPGDLVALTGSPADACRQLKARARDAAVEDAAAVVVRVRAGRRR